MLRHRMDQQGTKDRCRHRLDKRGTKDRCRHRLDNRWTKDRCRHGLDNRWTKDRRTYLTCLIISFRVAALWCLRLLVNVKLFMNM